MGVINNITIDKFPEQTKYQYTRVVVCFHFDLSNTINGLIVRDDKEPPYTTIIRLDDGRYLLATECQYSWVREP